MTALSITGVRHGYGGPPVLDGLDLDVEDGELVAVLGPSGCGKTTLLRIVAGFEELDAGTVTLAGRRVERLLPEARGIGVVPQEGALFPHLTVAQNVGYGLPRRSTARVAEMLELIGLPDLGSRRPAELSGGQQQRVALGRALAPGPAVVLLDEPFSALDAGTRVEMRTGLRNALAVTGASGLLVTHDAAEALSLADRVAVLDGGRIAQVAPPDELYAAPVSRVVARAVGEVDELPGSLRDGVVTCALGELPVHVALPPGPVAVLLRPEQLVVDDQAGSGLPAVVVDRSFAGADWLIRLRLPDGTTVSARSRGRPPAVDAKVWLSCSGAVAVVPERLPSSR